MSDDLDHLFGETPEESEAAPAVPAEQPAEAPPEQPNPEPEEPAPAELPPVTTAVPVTPPPGFVPQPALDEARHRLRQTEQELERLRQAAQPQQPEAPQIPDPVEDPQGFEAYQVQREASIRWSAITSTSMLLAQQTHTPEVVDEAAKAFAAEAAQKPWLVQELQRQPHPYDWVVNRHKREQALASVTPEDLVAFQAWKAAQAAGTPLTVAAPAPAAPPQSAPTPPRSINAAPSAGGVTHEPEPADPFDAVFAKKG